MKLAGRKIGLAQGHKGSKWRETPVATGSCKCHRIPLSCCGHPPGKPQGSVTLQALMESSLHLPSHNNNNNHVLFSVFPHINSKNPQAHFADGESEAERAYILLFCFLRWSLALLPGWRAVVPSHCNLHLLGSSNSCDSASRVAGITGVHHRAWLIFIFFSRDGGFTMLTRLVSNS